MNEKENGNIDFFIENILQHYDEKYDMLSKQQVEYQKLLDQYVESLSRKLALEVSAEYGAGVGRCRNDSEREDFSLRFVDQLKKKLADKRESQQDADAKLLKAESERDAAVSSNLQRCVSSFAERSFGHFKSMSDGSRQVAGEQLFSTSDSSSHAGVWY